MNADITSPSGTVTRLAPSPTGALHLGNARTFMVNHLLARQNGWRVLMRVEDLDGPRIKAGADRQLLEELAWLGLSWEQPVVYQSQRAAAYRAALDELTRVGCAYPCTCSRKDAELAGAAPHAGEHGGIYPNTCRGRWDSAEAATAQTGRAAAWRVIVDDAAIEFHDRVAGSQSVNLAQAGGDFVIFKADGLAAYQLAVVVDDAQAGVDAIVRGQDLLESTARQIHLRRLLGLNHGVEYWHLPLVVGPDGRRLAKRHGDTRLAHYRQAGATAERILGLLGYWCGLLPKREECDLARLEAMFHLTRLPREPIVFSAEDEEFLTQI